MAKSAGATIQHLKVRVESLNKKFKFTPEKSKNWFELEVYGTNQVKIVLMKSNGKGNVPSSYGRSDYQNKDVMYDMLDAINYFVSAAKNKTNL